MHAGPRQGFLPDGFSSLTLLNAGAHLRHSKEGEQGGQVGGASEAGNGHGG